MDSDKILFGFCKWMAADTSHQNRLAPGTTPELNEEFNRSLLVFANANGLSKPPDLDGIVMPSYDY